jgi:hypothetical protein
MFVYQADVYCDECMKALRAELDADGVVNDGDSGSYPQWFDGESQESDSPQHCGNGPDVVFRWEHFAGDASVRYPYA